MLYIEESGSVKASSRDDVESSQTGAVAEGKESWLDTTLGEVFRKSFFVFEIVFGAFVKMFLLAFIVFILCSLVYVLPLAAVELVQMFSKDSP